MGWHKWGWHICLPNSATPIYATPIWLLPSEASARDTRGAGVREASDEMETQEMRRQERLPGDHHCPLTTIRSLPALLPVAIATRHLVSWYTSTVGGGSAGSLLKRGVLILSPA